MYDDLRRFHNIHQGETCVIIGNGPSLDKTDLFKLDHYVTFGSNRIFDKPFTPYYYCIIDKRMMRSCLPLPESFYPVGESCK